MTERLTVDTITSDQLAALQLRAARMEHATKQAAELRVRLEDAEEGITAAIRQRKEQEDRALRAEHALVRVRALANRIALDSGWGRQTAEKIRATLDKPSGPAAATWTPPPPGDRREHTYLSTGCFHRDHAYCQSMTGLNGAKRPGECKHCGAKCVCPCHATTERN